MKKQFYEIKIAAPRKKVWGILWNEDTYKKWAAVFSEGSRAESNWEEGDKVLFLNKNNDGMVSKIARKIPYEYMSFKHIGEVHKGREQIGNENNEWFESYENYTLESNNGNTQLKVAMEAADEYLDYFNKTLPLALKKIKELSETNES